jgi:hypothetical protein
MCAVASVKLVLADAAALHALFDQQLSKGRAFVPGVATVSELQACDLVLEHAGRTHTLPAEAVFVKTEGPGCGVGLQLARLDEAGKGALRAFVQGSSLGAAAPEQPAIDEGQTMRLQERVRSLSTVEQQRLAVKGTLTERVTLERAFGANVWESLLSNPRITSPEVATIARKGTLPRPLVENIAGHPSWVAVPEVQRALLSNPRASGAVIAKVLQAMARSDLILVPQQTAYPQTVRAAAKKMLG